MKGWITLGLALFAPLSLASRSWAQPAVAAAPAGGAVAVAGPAGATAVATAAPNNIWTKICMTPEQRDACRARWCASSFGQMATAMMAPTTVFTGGLCKSHCLFPTKAELALPPTSAGGAAARIKQDELEAAARRADVRYLGTVDCHYWPEAEEALINALRGDRNECVRLEAALSLTRGCCCTQKTIEALTISVTGSDRDGFPTEKSERVRCVAAEALAHCTHVYHKVQVAPLPVPPVNDQNLPVLPEPNPRTQLSPKQYYEKIGITVTKSQAMDKADRVLATTNLPIQPPAPLEAANGTPRGSEGLLGIVARGISTAPKQTPPPPMQQPVPQTQPSRLPPPVTNAIPTSVPAPKVNPAYLQQSQAQPAPAETPAQATSPVQQAETTSPRPASRGLIPLVIGSFRSNN